MWGLCVNMNVCVGAGVGGGRSLQLNYLSMLGELLEYAGEDPEDIK